MKAQNIVSTETDRHVIEVSEGCLTIGTKHFPGDCVSLTPEETTEALKLLLVQRYGAHMVKGLERALETGAGDETRKYPLG